MFSEYFETLNQDAKARYVEKIKRINKIDPYLLPKRELSKNVEDFPDLSHVDMKKVPFILDPLKYGDFLYPGKKTYYEKKQHKPDIEELTNVMECEDHTMPLEEFVRRLDTDLEKGLREDQVNSIRERYGENILGGLQKVNLADLLNRVRGTYYVAFAGILFCFITVSIPTTRPPGTSALDDLYLGIILILLIVISASISLWQEQKCSEIMNSLKVLYPQYASVIRDGKKVRISKKDIVVGDLVLLKAGNNIPADIRITKAWNMRVDEFPLICDPGATMKTPECTNKNPATTQNIAYYGTLCVQGYGQGIAFATGNRTAYGQMLKEMILLQEMDTSAYEEIRRVLRLFGVFTAAIGIIILPMTLELYAWTVIAVTMFSQVVASMPNIIYSTITACFYEAANRMVSKNCLPKDFEAVENLGSISVICCDKTGTITQNRMTIVRLWLNEDIIKVEPSEDRSEMMFSSTPDSETWYAFARSASLCNSISSKSRRLRCVIKKGCSCDQSEVAIMEFINNVTSSTKVKLDDIQQKYEKVFEIPYTSYNKYHVTIHHTVHSTSTEGCSYILCMKGAVDEILKFCSSVLINGKDTPISSFNNKHFENTFEEVMKNGERVIGYCDFVMPKDQYPHGHIFEESDVPQEGLRFLGFVSILDPPRASVPEAIKRCKQAGIKVILMTGDHPVTGKAIAQQTGIISTGSHTPEDIMQRFNIKREEVTEGSAKAVVVTGSEIDSMNRQQFWKLMNQYEEFVFARITPKHKIKIVECLQRGGNIVAVTGDSKEDSLAMHKADIGIGMGMHGCDISREIADIILLGDNFDSVVSAIEEGRVIYENLRKATAYVLSSNAPEVLPLVIAGFLQIPFPMGAMFIILISLITETFTVLLLAKEKVDGDIMKRKGFGPSNFFDRRLFHGSYCQVGVLCSLGGLFVFFFIMAENGFMPTRLFGIAKVWNSRSVNDLKDSFNQEWSYSSRKSLEYACQTAFFLCVIILQLFNLALFRTPIHDRTFRYSKHFEITRLFICACQLLVVLFFMYTPHFSKAFHFYDLKLTDWILCLPFPLLLLTLEELRRYTILHSSKDSWLERETF